MGGPVTGDLELLRAFVNTTTAEHLTDDLATPARMQEWLVARSLLPESAVIDEGAHRDVLEFREAVRAVALANGGEDVDPRAVVTLNRAAARLQLSVQFGDDGSATLVAGGDGADQVLGRLASAMFTATVDGSFARLKACANDTCRWLFYDRSRNRSRKWCEMQTCGNMINARAYRKRHQAEVSETEGAG
jgi:predicted RNA-binding Zn ribbon-like protein